MLLKSIKIIIFID